MYAGKDFNNADPGETDVYSLDFTNDLHEDETVVSAAWTCEAVVGTDASASSRLSGAPVYADNAAGVQTITSHTVAGLLEGGENNLGEVRGGVLEAEQLADDLQFVFELLVAGQAVVVATRLTGLDGTLSWGGGPELRRELGVRR